MQVAIGHQGEDPRRVRILSAARACHSSLAPLGVNAVEYAAELIAEISRRARYHFAAQGRGATELYDVAHTTLLSSVVHGGTALNIVPDSLRGGIRAARGLGVSEAKEVTDSIVAWTLGPA